MFKPVLVVGLLSFAALPAMAQDYPRVEFGGGYAYIRANVTARDATTTPPTVVKTNFDLHGGRGEVAVNVNRAFGIVADVGGSAITGLPSGTSASMVTYMFGPRLTYRNAEKIEPFVHALFGGAHVSGSTSGTISGFEFSGTENSFAMALGGGLDYKISNHVAIRFVQAEYLMTRFKTNINAAGTDVAATQNNLRIGAGLQFRF